MNWTLPFLPGGSIVITLNSPFNVKTMEGKLMEYAQERLAKYDASPEEHPQVYL